MSLTLSRVWCNVLQVVCLADGYRVSGVLWNHAVWSILVAEVQTRENLGDFAKALEIFLGVLAGDAVESCREIILSAQ